MRTRDEFVAAAARLRQSPVKAPGQCCSCIAWEVAQTQAVGATEPEMQCGRSRYMAFGLYGQDNKPVLTSAVFGCRFHQPNDLKDVT